MNEIVKYENQLNATPLRNFNAVDLDFLMLLCHKFRDEGTKNIKFDLTEIRNLANYKFEGNDRLIKDLKQMNSKLLGCNFMYQDTHKIVQFVLFSTFVIDLTELTLEVSVNENFAFLLNNLERNFTKFELNEFINLKSSYAKECYRRLKQFRDTGIWIVTIDEFRNLLDIPQCYKQGNIDQQILNPIQKELKPLFNNFSITKQYKRGRGRGGKVVSGLIFKFDEEINIHTTKRTPQNTSKYQETSFICRECGKPLYSAVLNGNACYCHDLRIQGDSCKKIYNTVAEIQGYDERPNDNNQNLDEMIEEENKATPMPDYIKKQMAELGWIKE